jgi:hypothetical protein
MLTERLPRALHDFPRLGVLRVLRLPDLELLDVRTGGLGQTRSPRSSLEETIRFDAQGHKRPHLVARWSVALTTCFSTVL